MSSSPIPSFRKLCRTFRSTLAAADFYRGLWPGIDRAFHGQSGKLDSESSSSSGGAEASDEGLGL